MVVTRTEGRSGGAGVGLGVEASPLGLELGVEGKADFTVTQGAAWEFPDARGSRALPRRQRASATPTWRFGEAGDVLTAEAAAKVGGATLTGVEASMQAAARRARRARAARRCTSARGSTPVRRCGCRGTAHARRRRRRAT